MFRMILPATSGDVAAAEAASGDDTPPVDADAAAARTRADYGRVSRWALGLVGTAGAAVAGVAASGAVAMVAGAGHPLDVAFGGILLLIAAALAVPSVWLLVALHRSGRRLARAAAYWAALPYRQGRRTPTKGDWFAVRFLAFSADLFLRLITSALAALASVFAVTGVVRTIVTHGDAWELCLWASWAVLFVAVCVGQFGGVQRIQSGHLPRDPASLPRR